MKCLILASGFGTLLYPLALNKAKSLLVYKNEGVLTHIVRNIPDELDIYVTTNKKFEKDFISWQENKPRNVELIVEDVWNEEQSLDAIGSPYHAIKAKSIGEDVIVLAGDNYFEFSISEFLKSCNGHNVLVAVRDIGNKDEAMDFGVVSLEDSKIIDFEEKPSHPKSSLIATSCYVLPARVLPLLEKYCVSDRRDNLGDFIRFLVEEDEVYAYPFEDIWLDIGSVYGTACRYRPD